MGGGQSNPQQNTERHNKANEDDINIRRPLQQSLPQRETGSSSVRLTQSPSQNRPQVNNRQQINHSQQNQNYGTNTNYTSNQTSAVPSRQNLNPTQISHQTRNSSQVEQRLDINYAFPELRNSLSIRTSNQTPVTSSRQNLNPTQIPHQTRNLSTEQQSLEQLYSEMRRFNQTSNQTSVASSRQNQNPTQISPQTRNSSQVVQRQSSQQGLNSQQTRRSLLSAQVTEGRAVGSSSSVYPQVVSERRRSERTQQGDYLLPHQRIASGGRVGTSSQSGQSQVTSERRQQNGPQRSNPVILAGQTTSSSHTQQIQNQATQRTTQQRTAKIQESAFDEDDLEDVPQRLICPITQELMKDPVMLVQSGQVYERSTIQKWLGTASTDPLTNIVLTDKTLVPVHLLRAECQEMREKGKLSCISKKVQNLNPLQLKAIELEKATQKFQEKNKEVEQILESKEKELLKTSENYEQMQKKYYLVNDELKKINQELQFLCIKKTTTVTSAELQEKLSQHTDIMNQLQQVNLDLLGISKTILEQKKQCEKIKLPYKSELQQCKKDVERQRQELDKIMLSTTEENDKESENSSQNLSSQFPTSASQGNLSTPKNKTAICKFWEKEGVCKRGDNCNFAHGQHELKSVICKFWEKDGVCKKGDKCDFAHGQHESKSVICKFWEKDGVCKKGDNCNFAHGSNELKSSPSIKQPKYKTQLCQFYSKFGTCKYGSKCRFIHDIVQTIPDDMEPVPLFQGKEVQEIEEEQQGDAYVDEGTLDRKDIQMVMQYANVSRMKAIKALQSSQGDMVSAIMELTK